MKMLFSFVLLLAIVSTAIIGCQSSTDETTATPTGGATTTPTPAETAGQPTPTVSPATTPAPGETDPVNFNSLIAFLPDAPSGWEADVPEGGTVLMQEWAYSQVSRDYTHQTTDEYVSVFIYDSAFYQGFAWFAAWQYKFEYQTTEGYGKSKTVSGYPAWEIYDEPDSYTLMILLSDRFFVLITAETESTLNQFSNAMNYDVIAALR